MLMLAGFLPYERDQEKGRVALSSQALNARSPRLDFIIKVTGSYGGICVPAALPEPWTWPSAPPWTSALAPASCSFFPLQRPFSCSIPSRGSHCSQNKLQSPCHGHGAVCEPTAIFSHFYSLFLSHSSLDTPA